MDLSLIGAATTAVSTARDICKAAIGLRDFNQMAAAVTQLNIQLIKAQDSLIAHSGQIDALQREVFEIKDLLREKDSALREAQHEIANINQKKLELDQYERVKHASGGWAIHRKGAAPGDESDPYYCASCFDRDQLSTLQPGAGPDRLCLVCHRCASKIRRD